MSIMLQELLSAPTYLKTIIEANQETIEQLTSYLKKKPISFITTVARGTSNNAANYFKYLCEQQAGIMVTKYNHSVTTIAEKTTKLEESLCIGISQSGMGDDTIKVMETAKEQGAITLAITNNIDSPLARLCDYHLFLNCKKEESVAATKTYTMQIACMQLVASLLANKKIPNLTRIASQAIAYITTKLPDIKQLALQTKDINNMIILSRGESLPLAEEMSLKLLETCYKLSRCYSVAEFAHGPYALIEPQRPVILLAPKGIYSKDFVNIAKRLKSDGATIIAITDIKEIENLADYSLEVPYHQEDPYPYILTLQAYSALMAESLNLNPDKPRGLKKVTQTF